MVIERYTARKEILSEVCQVEVSRIQGKGKRERRVFCDAVPTC